MGYISYPLFFLFICCKLLAKSLGEGFEVKLKKDINQSFFYYLFA